MCVLCIQNTAYGADYGDFIPPSGPTSETVLMNSFSGMINPSEVVAIDETTSYKKGEYRAVDYNIIPVERLEDNVIDYDELGSLVYFNNLTVNQITDALNKTKSDYTYIRDYLNEEKHWAKVAYEDAEDEMDMEEYINNYTLHQIYKASAKSYSDVVKKLSKYSTQKPRIDVERQFTKGAQSLFLAYKSVDLQLNTLYQLREIYRSTLSNLEANRTVGFVTDSNVDKAENMLEAAEINIATLEETRDKLKNSLCSLLGLDASKYEIGSIDYNNFAYYDNIYYDRDLYFAVNKNKSLLDTRHTSAHSSYARELKDKEESVGEDTVEMKFKSLYNTVENARADYELSLKSMEIAERVWSKDNQQMELGMMTNAGMEQAKLSYVQAQVGLDSTALAYYQAMVNYDWATRGYMD